MLIKITEKNLDYINKVRFKYNRNYKNPITLHQYNCIDIDKNDYDPLKTSHAYKSDNFICFETFKKLYPLEEINKPIELW
jgi:hypothetical protein